MHQFSGVTEIVHDSLGHADCLGSGYIMRRAAVEDVGGFPTESLSEDVCCSARLLGAGWKTCFIPESLQHGSVPESYNAHVKQRTRWVSQVFYPKRQNDNIHEHSQTTNTPPSSSATSKPPSSLNSASSAPSAPT
jgi:GT2 family glycosyltransferase